MTTSRPTLLTLAVLLSALLWPSPAQAADEIGLSRDGVTWTPGLAMPLFESSRLWVPGDDEIRTFQLRNQGPSAASMTFEALNVGGSDLLAADIALSVRIADGPWVPLGVDTAKQDVTVRPLETGQAVRIDVRAVFDPASTNVTHELALPLTLRVTLADAAAGGGDGVPDEGGDGAVAPTDRSGALPGAGTTIGPRSILAGLVLCALGAFLIARRSSSEDDAQNGAT